MSLLSLDGMIAKTKRGFNAAVVSYVKDQLSQGKAWKDVAIQMGYKIEDTDYLDLAGAMIVEHMKAHGPTSIPHYVSVMSERLDPKVADFLLLWEERLTQLMLKFEYRDYAYNFFSAMNLRGLYVAKPSYDEDGFESPSYFYLRVIVGLFYDWKQNIDIPPCDVLGYQNADDLPIYLEEEAALLWIEKVYEEAVCHRIAFATPTLFSSGFKQSQKASCFLLQVGDNLEEILGAVGKMGLISKYKGGIGLDISQIRHSNIGSVGMSSGTRNLVLLYDRLVRYVDQLGVRKGAATIYQRPQHPDVLDFISVVDKEERGVQESAPNIDNAIWMNWMFFKRVKGDKGGKWTLFCPAKAPSLNHLYGEDFIKEYERLEALYEEWQGKEDLLKEYISGSKGEYKAKLEEQLEDVLMRQIILYGEVNDEYKELEAKRIELKKRIDGCETRVEKDHYKFILGLIKFTKQVHVDEIMDKIVEMQRKWGKPYILNGDAGNIKSNQKNLGYIRCSNLCTEIFEYTSKDEIACCNLGSLALGHYVWKINNSTNEGDLEPVVDFNELGNNTRMMVMLLNRVIDNNFYPVKEAENSNFLHRPIGLGVCGWGDMLNKMRIPVDDPRAFELNKKVAACIYYNACLASSFLADKFGSYSSFLGSPISEAKFQFDLWQEEYKILERNGLLNPKVRKWEDQLPIDPKSWAQRDIEFNDGLVIGSWDALRQKCFLGMRNSLLIARMPTATSASLSGSTESAEIYTHNLYTKNVLKISAPIVNYHMVKDLKSIGLWNVHTIDFIRCCDGSISQLHSFIEKFPQRVPEFWPKPLESECKLETEYKGNYEKLAEFQKLYKIMFDVSQKVFLQQAADAGIYICQGQSLNLYFPDPSPQQLKMAMLMSFDLGLKTNNYYVRSLASVKPNLATMDAEIEEFGIQMRNEMFFKSKGKSKGKGKTQRLVTMSVFEGGEGGEMILKEKNMADIAIDGMITELDVKYTTEYNARLTVPNAKPTEPEVCRMEENCLYCQS